MWTAPISKCEPAPINKCETASINKCETAPINKCETASINKCETASINKCETAPINKCEQLQCQQKHQRQHKIWKKENIPERKNFKFSLSKKFTLTFDTQLSFLIYSNLIKFIYVLSDKRLIIYTENHSLTVVSFNIDKREWIRDFKMTDSKIYFTFACCEINDNLVPRALL